MGRSRCTLTLAPTPLSSHSSPFLPSQVTVHVIVPAAVLAADPLPGAVALHSLKDAVAAHKAGGIKLPSGCTR